MQHFDLPIKDRLPVTAVFLAPQKILSHDHSGRILIWDTVDSEPAEKICMTSGGGTLVDHVQISTNIIFCRRNCYLPCCKYPLSPAGRQQTDTTRETFTTLITLNFWLASLIGTDQHLVS